MNLKKMRELKWVDEVNAIFTEYRQRLKYFDQDILNIFFNRHPGKLKIFIWSYVLITHNL